MAANILSFPLGRVTSGDAKAERIWRWDKIFVIVVVVFLLCLSLFGVLFCFCTHTITGIKFMNKWWIRYKIESYQMAEA